MFQEKELKLFKAVNKSLKSFQFDQIEETEFKEYLQLRSKCDSLLSLKVVMLDNGLKELQTFIPPLLAVSKQTEFIWDVGMDSRELAEKVLKTEADVCLFDNDLVLTKGPEVIKLVKKKNKKMLCIGYSGMEGAEKEFEGIADGSVHKDMKKPSESILQLAKLVASLKKK